MDLGLEGTRAYVTAASGGLGRAVAHELVAEGARVVVASRDTDRLREAAASIRSATGCDEEMIEWVVCDLTDEAAVRERTDEAIDILGGLDILVTNHGGPATTRFPDLSVSEFDDAYRSILCSTVLACRSALPSLREGGGAITNLVAASALEPSAGGVLGNVFRPGIYGLSKVLAEEYGCDGVRVNCVSPRGVMSDRIQFKLSEMAAREGITELHLRLPSSTLVSPRSWIDGSTANSKAATAVIAAYT
ncbi:SDR family NAD(P)-dependent oxidoreductase [Halegenticoccus tardaugens]|uniref:SDR family NAD(P)-dependent oxidoreductase n=1 Tax=Halegenticoccus tardaugens TaxID=2071624 RepID=UPI00100ADCC8|nr:SDR family NAD(P)-dependent oxidoreductase [Halegenticoccus tardaugens]